MLICIPKTKEYRTKTKEYKASSVYDFCLQSFCGSILLNPKKAKRKYGFEKIILIFIKSRLLHKVGVLISSPSLAQKYIRTA